MRWGQIGFYTNACPAPISRGLPCARADAGRQTHCHYHRPRSCRHLVGGAEEMSSHSAWARNLPALGGSRVQPKGVGCHLQKRGDNKMSRRRGLVPVPAILVEPPYTCHVEGCWVGAAGGLGRWVGGGIPAVVIT